MTKSKLILLAVGQANKSGEEVLEQEKQLYLESQDSKQMVDKGPREPSCWGLDASFFYRTKKKGGEEVK